MRAVPFLALLPLFACTPTPEDAAPDFSAPEEVDFDLPPVDRAPAPGVLNLVSSPWLAGENVTITVSNALPFDTVALLFTGNPGGPQTCPPVMAPECLDLDSPRMYGTEMADGAGVATFSFGLPDPPPPVPEVQLQAVMLLYGGGADTSNAPIHAIHETTDDLDLDGLTTADELLNGTDPENADTDGGTVNDGDEILNGTDPLDPADDVVVVPITWDADIYPHMQANCGATCHTDGAADGGFNADVYTNVVDQPSNDVATMDRIEPGLPDDSYIWHKLNDTHLGVGGNGLQMPRGTGGVPLDQVDLDMWEAWILDGAPEN